MDSPSLETLQSLHLLNCQDVDTHRPEIAMLIPENPRRHEILRSEFDVAATLERASSQIAGQILCSSRA
jgi:hypothetical protein